MGVRAQEPQAAHSQGGLISSNFCVENSKQLDYNNKTVDKCP